MSRGNRSGFGFTLVGVLVLAGIAGLIVTLAITGSFYAYGIFGLAIILLVVVLALMWFSDRRRVRRFEDAE